MIDDGEIDEAREADFDGGLRSVEPTIFGDERVLQTIRRLCCDRVDAKALSER